MVIVRVPDEFVTVTPPLTVSPSQVAVVEVVSTVRVAPVARVATSLEVVRVTVPPLATGTVHVEAPVPVKVSVHPPVSVISPEATVHPPQVTVAELDEHEPLAEA